jgi:hypothetical protein
MKDIILRFWIGFGLPFHHLRHPGADTFGIVCGVVVLMATVLLVFALIGGILEAMPKKGDR